MRPCGAGRQRFVEPGVSARSLASHRLVCLLPNAPGVVARVGACRRSVLDPCSMRAYRAGTSVVGPRPLAFAPLHGDALPAPLLTRDRSSMELLAVTGVIACVAAYRRYVWVGRPGRATASWRDESLPVLTIVIVCNVEAESFRGACAPPRPLFLRTPSAPKTLQNVDTGECVPAETGTTRGIERATQARKRPCCPLAPERPEGTPATHSNLCRLTL